jgi:hypothetical protein
MLPQRCMIPHLTAPNRAPSHSFFSVSTVFSGSATPFFLNSSNPASRCTKEKSRPKLLGRASRIFLPAGMTSRPMPSPGRRPANRVSCGHTCRVQLGYSPMRRVLEAIVCVYVKLLVTALLLGKLFGTRRRSRNAPDSSSFTSRRKSVASASMDGIQ